MFFPHFNEIESLCNALAEGECSSEDLRRLKKLVLSSDAAARYYVRFFNIHSEIKNSYLEEDYQASFKEMVNQFLAKAEKEPHSSDEVSTEDGEICRRSGSNTIFPLLDLENMLAEAPLDGMPISSKSSRGDRDGLSWGNLGAYVPLIISCISLILILGSVLVLPIYWARKAEQDAWKVVARVKRTVECRWKGEENSFSNGTFLISGQQLDLRSGLAEIEFSSGAKVILQGPARFVTSDRNTLQLIYGRLTANVPKGANGFTVFTPRHEVVDLGTEFGVFVDEGIGEPTEIHVFNGLVEVESNVSLPSRKTIRLSKNKAILCDPKTNRITHVPANPYSFAHDLESLSGVTLTLNLSNPSFENPDIRTLPGFQSEHGDTGLTEIQGWKYSGIYSDGLPIDSDEWPPSQAYVIYQISPHKSSVPAWSVGPGATDGQQVIVVELQANNQSQKGVRQAWLYQSLGTVGVVDVGKRLLLEVDAGPRTNYSKGSGTLMASFATHVTPERAGVYVGNSGIFSGIPKQKSLKTIQAILPITSDLIGQELFIVLTAMDNQYSQYHFDNVRVSVVSNEQKGEKDSHDPK